MNKNILLLLLLALASCSSDKSSDGKNEDFRFSYQLDTVLVDSKGVLFFLNQGLMGASLSPDSNKLFTYNEPMTRLDIVDLEKLEFLDSIPLEKEGPNGIGPRGILRTHVTDLGDYYFSVYGGIKEFDTEGKVKRAFNWTKDEEILNQLENGELVFFNDIISSDGATYFGMYTASHIPGKPQQDGIVLMDLNTKKLQLIDIPALKALQDYQIQLEMNGRTSFAGDQTFLLVNGSKILISQGPVNGVSVYDLDRDSLKVYSYETELLPARNPGDYTRKVGSVEEFQVAWDLKSKEPHFGDFMYDAEHNLYYRVSHISELKSDGELEWNGVLSIFDEDFNLLHEEDGLGNYHGEKFLRNGKIYRFINFDDEMAFEVLTPKYDYE
ncbi:DUF4221 family protein [Algoriphagus antarcticus]|uniref:Uncharacterized protein DUF4221 n=1 Tax=Algoriphagus antarcticus TaxID=238540 RepID=A0A3E0DTS8_9BACT|nr:DUF4221 family protein [Algoriphagus antarcticus]REG86308.1 uncharacterized protein DUF4221 [Algoriphagus antarcticus]